MPVKKIKNPAARIVVSGNTCFWINNGPVVKNLSELNQAIKQMDNEKFGYHTKENGNHFATWIEEVLGDAKLAARIKRLKTRTGVTKALDKYLNA